MALLLPYGEESALFLCVVYFSFYITNNPNPDFRNRWNSPLSVKLIGGEEADLGEMEMYQVMQKQAKNQFLNY